MQVGTIQKLYDEAVTQNEVVFTATGLTVYAAPWRYAIASKLDRLSKSGSKSYDLSDAVAYLKKLIAKKGGTAVKKSELKDWAKEFGFTNPSDDTVKKLKDEYKEKEKKDGIVD